MYFCFFKKIKKNFFIIYFLKNKFIVALLEAIKTHLKAPQCFCCVSTAFKCAYMYNIFEKIKYIAARLEALKTHLKVSQCFCGTSRAFKSADL